MFSFNFGALVSLAEGLVSGKANILEDLVVEKLEEKGKEFFSEFISYQPEAFIKRTKDFAATRGASELSRLAQHLKPSLPAPKGVALVNQQINKFEQAFLKNKHLLSRPEGPYQRFDKSRQQWLDESWKHDWRSQPRDYHGRWMPGRLRTPYVSKGARRIRRQRRAAARKAVKQAFKGYKDLT